jgi:hypothetical protein
VIIVPSNVSAAPKLLTFKGAQYGNGTSIAIPSHSPGDLLILTTYRGYDWIYGPPAAGGTVPAWNQLLAESTGVGFSLSYAIATASNHTSGTWRGQSMTCSVVGGANELTPIGAYSYYYNTGYNVSIPAIQPGYVGAGIYPVKTDGSSMFISIYGSSQYTTGNFSAPSGYTAWPRSSDGTFEYQRFVWTKNVTTSAPGVQNQYPYTYTSGQENYSLQIEVLV